MAQSRKYTKIIKIWEATRVPDDYGGNTITTALSESIWANVTTKRATRENENGQNDNLVQTVFTVRNRYNLSLSVKDNFIKYGGLIYDIDGILNIDLDNIDVQILATQRT